MENFTWYYLRCGLYFIRIYFVLYHLLKVFLSRRKQFLSQVFFKAIKQLQIVFRTLYIVSSIESTQFVSNVFQSYKTVLVSFFPVVWSWNLCKGKIVPYYTTFTCLFWSQKNSNLKTSFVLFSAHELVTVQNKVSSSTTIVPLTLPRPSAFAWRSFDYRASAKNVLVRANTVVGEVGCVS